jgi:hypothetical protein
MSQDSNDFSQASAWKAEIERSRRVAEPYWSNWQDNLNNYVGKSEDAVAANANGSNFVNVNADFYHAELKVAQLFYDTPSLTLTSQGAFKPQKPAAQIPGQPPQPTPDAAPIPTQ